MEHSASHMGHGSYQSPSPEPIAVHQHSHNINPNMADAKDSHTPHGGMAMSFHWGIEETILFEAWKTNTVGGLVGSMFGIILMAALYEGLKYYREYLFWKTYNSLQYKSVRFPTDKVVESSSEGNKIVQPSMWNLMHTYQTFLHGLQMLLSYFLMLVFMTYNIWLCLAVIVGAIVGYFLFGWKKSVVVDVTEHCH